ncbi:hypothetical protein M433DRAFT_130898 [Acidomyces richmondensis BFW]|nr:hypothetical protein M433DRAFT_130898 [Acidomyces richmondensis BFW]
MLWVAGICSAITTSTALTLIVLHLRRYRCPKEQRQIIRIVSSVILYTFIAFFEVYSYESAQYIDPIGDFYESFGLCALFLLFIQYAAPSGTFDEETFSAVRSQQEQDISFDWPRMSWIFVFQYPVFEFMALTIQETTEAANRFCSNSLSPKYGHLWVEILQSFSITFCVLAIVQFYYHTKTLMKTKRGFAKIVLFKIIVFLRFTQAWVFSILLEHNVIKTSTNFSYNDILWGLPATVTCVEMVLFAIGFWYAFSSTEYGSSVKPRDRPLPLWKAVPHALNPWDLLVGIARVPQLFMELHRAGEWKKWRIAQRNAGITGLVRKGVQKYKNKKSDGDGRYQAMDEGMEPMARPKPTQHGRSESAITQGSTEYVPLAGFNAQQMYHPPAQSPPETSSGYLMADDFSGRNRSGSAGEWNGQRYYRSPSPSPSPGFEGSSVHGRDMV